MSTWPTKAFLAASIALATTSVASAAPWSEQPAKLIVPFGAGGNTDLVARIAAQRLSARLGQRFIVENKLGAAGAIAAEFVAKAPPNGETFFLGTTPQISILPLISKINYDPQKDYDPISNVATNPFVLGIHPSIPAKTLAEFIAYAKARPGQLNYGSAGSGGSPHMAMEMFLMRTGTRMTHVPFRGAGPMLIEAVAGRLQASVDNIPSCIGHIRDGRLRALAVTGATRSSVLPEVPTLAETVVPGFEATAWFGIGMPKGTPVEIVNKVNAEVNRMLKDPGMIAKFAKGARMLDLCCYSAGFSLNAKVNGGAEEVTAVDLDEAAVAMAKRNANLNQARIKFVHTDAFAYARQMATNGEKWDVVVLDPPKLIRTRDEADEGRRRYFDLNRLALQLVAPGGWLLTCSCSGLMPAEEFQRTVAAAIPEGRRATILYRTGAAPDHPIATNCPETEYLKALWLRVE